MVVLCADISMTTTLIHIQINWAHIYMLMFCALICLICRNLCKSDRTKHNTTGQIGTDSIIISCGKHKIIHLKVNCSRFQPRLIKTNYWQWLLIFEVFNCNFFESYSEVFRWSWSWWWWWYFLIYCITNDQFVIII